MNDAQEDYSTIKEQKEQLIQELTNYTLRSFTSHDKRALSLIKTIEQIQTKDELCSLLTKQQTLLEGSNPYPKAEQNFKSAIRADPRNTMGYLGLSDLYVFFYKEKESQAEAVLKQGIAANPGDANLAHALVRLYERRAK